MNNIIIDRLPKQINGIEINTNFRNSMIFETMIKDDSMPVEEKLNQCLLLYYSKETIKNNKHNIGELFDNILYFYSAGRIASIEEEPNKKKKAEIEGRSNGKQIYSFEYDADYIYSAFLSDYGIDLQDIEYLHWWKFRALFMSLNEENKICKIMEYRSINTNKIENKEQKAFYNKMKRIYALPDNRTEAEKEADMVNAFDGMF